MNIIKKIYMTNKKYYVQPNIPFPYCNSSNKYIQDDEEYKDIGEYIYYFRPSKVVNVDIKKYNNEYKKRRYKINTNIKHRNSK